METRDRLAILITAPLHARDTKSPGSKQEASDIADLLPEVALMADIEPITVSHLPASAWTPSEQLKLAHDIQSKAPTYDGFIVVHPWRSITMTAAFVAHALSGLKKPIAFMGPHPSEEEKGYLHRIPHAFNAPGSRAYLINVLQVVIHGYVDVMVIDGASAYRAVRASTTTMGAQFSIEPYKSETLGRIDVGFSMKVKEHAQKSAPSVTAVPRLATWNPLFSDEHIALSAGAEALFVDCTHVRKCSEEMKRQYESLDIPVLIYECGGSKHPHGIHAPDMTRESAIAKFLLSAGAARDAKEIQLLMDKNWRGEII